VTCDGEALVAGSDVAAWDNPCNMPPMENFPFGGCVQSTCPAFCDLRLAAASVAPPRPTPTAPSVACGFPFDE